MSHTSFQEKGRTFEAEADYVVVGSGAGGATVAAQLARGGVSVAIVEAGAWRDPEHYPSSSHGAMRDLFDDWGSTIAMGRAFWPVVQARTMGGTTVINSAICVRTPGDIFEMWEKEHGVGGIEMAKKVWANQDEVERELFVTEVPVASRGRSNNLAMEGANALGYESHVIHRYAKGCVGSGQCLQGCRTGAKQSTNLNYVPEVLAKGGEVLSCAPVDKVLFDKKRRAVGVTGWFQHPKTKKWGAKFNVRAKKAVIIAASATHTPCILMRSGVKNDNLGRFFRAHPGTGVYGVYDDPVDMNIGATQGWASTAYREDPGLKLETLSIPPEMVITRLKGGGKLLMERMAEYRKMAMWIQAVRANSHGRVRNGMGGKPMVTYTLDRADMEKFVRGMHLVAKTHFAAGAKKVVPAIAGMPYSIGPDEVDKLLDAPRDPRAYVAILSHLFGGAVMGSDPTRSVVDANGKVHHYDGLYVADASALPTVLGVNPQHTIMGIAKLRAQQLLDT
ncbi:MAG: GMC family oxidoreductase [Proteobacteria bacterium]|nr:GMC family oxidoreductase [Pseudomonadota bacterium]